MSDDRSVNFYAVVDGNFAGSPYGEHYYVGWHPIDVPSVEELYSHSGLFLNPRQLHTANYIFLNDKHEVICFLSYYFKIDRNIRNIKSQYSSINIRSIIGILPDHPAPFDKDGIAGLLEVDGVNLKGYRLTIPCEPTINYFIAVNSPGSIMEILIEKSRKKGE